MEKKLDRGLLRDEFCFYGKHARMVQQLKEPISAKIQHAFFASSVDLLIAASQIGMVEGKMGKVDKSSPETAKILADQMLQYNFEISRNFRAIMLLHEKETISMEERLERAFLCDNKLEKRKSLEEIFFSYVLGGLEIIYHNIYGDIGVVIEVDDIIRNSFSLIERLEKYRTLFNSNINKIISELGDD